MEILFRQVVSQISVIYHNNLFFYLTCNWLYPRDYKVYFNGIQVHCFLVYVHLLNTSMNLCKTSVEQLSRKYKHSLRNERCC